MSGTRRSKNWSAADRMAAIGEKKVDFGALDSIAAALGDGDQHALNQLFVSRGTEPPTVIWDPSAEVLPREGLKFLLAHWQGLVSGKALPLASELDPIDLKPALGNIILVDVVDGGRDFRYRLYGTKISLVSSGDKTGRYVTDFEGPPAEFFYVIYRAVLARRSPVYTFHYPTMTNNFRRWHRLLLPLYDESGEIVRYLIGCYADPKSEALDKL